MKKKWDLVMIKDFDFFAHFDDLNIQWHQKFDEKEKNPVIFEDMLWNLHFFNFSLWHEEDQARRKEVSDQVIAQNKRNIDKFNQSRNDYIELLDTYIITHVKSHPQYKDGLPLNSETPGSIIDRLSIISLKIYHMAEQMQRKDVMEAHRLACERKYRILLEQRMDLANCFVALINDYFSGKKSMKVYFQFKMYNDPNLNPALYQEQNEKEKY